MKNQVQLITYPDSLGGDLKALNTLLAERFAGVFGGVHILPPFPSSADRGFAPTTYFEIDPAFGTWDDVRAIAGRCDVMLDFMVNHISRRSEYFEDFARRGRRSPYADLFLTLDKIWPGGDPPARDVAQIFLRRPENPFVDVRVEESGQVERVWATFGTRDWSEQIDLDVRSPLTRRFIVDVLAHMQRCGVKIVRLDAVGYAIKKPGTSCFFVEPELYVFMEWVRGKASALGIEVLPEVHAERSVQARLAQHGYWVYDFVLPALVLHTLFARSSRALRAYLAACPQRQITQLDSHDGIPIQPDLDGVLSVDELQAVVQACVRRGANISPIFSAGHRRRADFDAHQVNCTYYSALGEDDDAYLAARAIQFFAPGVPQVYYAGALAARNDQAAVERSGERRAINRPNYTPSGVAAALERPVVQRLMRLIRLRNTHPAFGGPVEILDAPDDHVRLARQLGARRCQLDVDLRTGRARISGTDGDVLL